MKFLCVPCDVQMETQTEGIMPDVITSYSIHYTKLYEVLGVEQRARAGFA